MFLEAKRGRDKLHITKPSYCDTIAVELTISDIKEIIDPLTSKEDYYVFFEEHIDHVVVNDINDFKFTILKLQIMKYKIHWGSLNYPDPNILNNDLTLNEAKLYANDKIGIPAEEISDGHWYCQNESLYCEIIPIQ